MNRICDKCNVNIPHGNPYICITHHVEYMKKDMTTLRDTISVVQAEELMILCGDCGNRITKSSMKQMLNAIPNSQRTVMNN